MTFCEARNWIKENKYSEAVAHYVACKFKMPVTHV